jgi:bacterioferritin
MPKKNEAVVQKLNKILEMEISGVVRYLHYALMIMGPNRIPIVKWFHAQANEAFQHASIIGEKITALGGHPSLKVSAVPKSHAVMEILKESREFEAEALELYYDLLKSCGDDVALEEMVRGFIKLETEHLEEVDKMLVTTNK